LVVSEEVGSPKHSYAVDTPPSDDCPDDDDDTPTPPEGGDEPCGFDCWDPPPGDDDDPFNPPGFMTVQTWQTTSTGMAVTVYQPASADCPGDDDDPEDDEEFPCELTTTSLDGDSLFSTASEDDLQTFISTIEAHGMDFGLDTPEKVRHFLGQTAHETGGELTVAEEAGVFTGEWDTEKKLRDNSDLIGPEAEFAAEDVLGNAELIANIMRAGRYGNGDYSSGDGWTYRGRGPMQLTWKGAYQNFSNFYQGSEYGTDNFVDNPELLSNDAEAGTLSALWYWDNRVMTKPFVNQDSLTVEDVTRAINGPGKRGLEYREDRTQAEVDNVNCSIGALTIN
jgi:putative chitinase